MSFTISVYGLILRSKNISSGHYMNYIKIGVVSRTLFSFSFDENVFAFLLEA